LEGDGHDLFEGAIIITCRNWEKSWKSSARM